MWSLCSLFPLRINAGSEDAKQMSFVSTNCQSVSMVVHFTSSFVLSDSRLLAVSGECYTFYRDVIQTFAGDGVQRSLSITP